MDFNDQIYKTQQEKFNAIIEEISACYQRKQPVLVGTISVDMSEILSRMLRRVNIPHNVLNAKPPARGRNRAQRGAAGGDHDRDEHGGARDGHQAGAGRGVDGRDLITGGTKLTDQRRAARRCRS